MDLYSIIYDFMTSLFPADLNSAMVSFCNLATYIILGLLIYVACWFTYKIFCFFGGLFIWK